jgi:FAD/FMN-containing dehydrogenase
VTTLDLRTPFEFAPLAATVSGRVATPGDTDWDEQRAAWNLSVDQRPEAVVRIRDTADAAAVVDFARRRGLRVAAQGTGHLAPALGDLAGAVLVRTDLLREIVVDREARTVRVGAGVTWGEVGAALEPFGLAALAGSSHDVGVVGYTLGGGYSWLSRRHGLAASSVVSIEIVTGDGVVRRASATENPELFWALRGGGGAFGVVTAIEFLCYPIETVVAGMLLFPLERAAEVLRAYSAWTDGLDDAATTAVRLLRMPPLPALPPFLRGRAFVGVDGAILATDAAADELLAPLRALGPEIDTFTRMPATRLSEIHMDPPQPSPARGGGLALEELSEEVIEVLLAAAGPGVDTPLLAVDLRHLGGALAEPDARGGAVDALEGRFLLYAVGITPVPPAVEAVEATLRGLLASLEPWAARTTYSNFVDEQVPASALFAPASLQRLAAVKAAVDPTNVIRSAHELG